MESLKFVDFEDFENKYFFRVLEEEEIYKGIVGYGQDDAIIKEGKGNKDYKDGRFFEGQWKNDKKEKEFTNMRTGMFMKAILKIIYSKEKEY